MSYVSVESESKCLTPFNGEKNDPTEKPLIAQLKIYSRRWYILFIYSVLSMEQSLFWITFSAVALESGKFFNWKSPTLNFLLALGPIGGLPFFFVAAWSLSTPFGLRWSTLASAALLFLGAAIRLFAILGPKEEWAIYVVSFAQLLIAIAGPFVMGGPTKLSNIWFPPNERTFATSISASSNNLGNAFGFVIGPILVDHVGYKWYLYIEAIFGFVVMVVAFLYFPESPPQPPSITASQEVPFSIRQFLEDLLEIILNWPYLILVIVGGLQSGAFSAWQGMYDFLLSPYGYTSEQIGWIANGNIFGGVLGSVVAGLLLDKILVHRFKESIILLFSMGSCFFLILTLSFSSPLSDKPVLYSAPWLIVSLITFIGFLFGCTYPIFYEFGVELTYPVRESSTSSVFVMLVNVFALILFFVNSYIPLEWIQPVVSFVVVACTIALLFVKNEYRRAKIDDKALTHEDTPTINS